MSDCDRISVEVTDCLADFNDCWNSASSAVNDADTNCRSGRSLCCLNRSGRGVIDRSELYRRIRIVARTRRNSETSSSNVNPASSPCSDCRDCEMDVSIDSYPGGGSACKLKITAISVARSCARLNLQCSACRECADWSCYIDSEIVTYQGWPIGSIAPDEVHV